MESSTTSTNFFQGLRFSYKGTIKKCMLVGRVKPRGLQAALSFSGTPFHNVSQKLKSSPLPSVLCFQPSSASAYFPPAAGFIDPNEPDSDTKFLAPEKLRGLVCACFAEICFHRCPGVVGLLLSVPTPVHVEVTRAYYGGHLAQHLSKLYADNGVKLDWMRLTQPARDVVNTGCHSVKQ